MAIIDHEKNYKSRLLQQYTCSPQLLSLVDALIGGQGDIEVTLYDLLTKRSIDTAEGAQLDIIGEIVGQGRQVVDLTGLELFGYQGAAGSIDGYGSISDATLGARYKGLDEELGSIKVLSDLEYRMFIKSKIIKNVRNLTTEDLIDSIRFIFGDTSFISVVEQGNHNVLLSIQASVPKATVQLLTNNDALPRPSGVSYTVTFVSGDGDPFAFDTFPGGSTFGTTTNPTLGGVFAEII